MTVIAMRRRRRARESPRRNRWTTPGIGDVYAQVMVARAMLMRIPDERMNMVEREMDILVRMLGRVIESRGDRSPLEAPPSDLKQFERREDTTWAARG